MEQTVGQEELIRCLKAAQEADQEDARLEYDPLILALDELQDIQYADVKYAKRLEDAAQQLGMPQYELFKATRVFLMRNWQTKGGAYEVEEMKH